MGWIKNNIFGDFEKQDSRLKIVHSDDRGLVKLIDPSLTDGPWIAGGAVLNWFLNEDIGDSDIDVFFKNQAQFDETFGRLMRNHAEMIYNSDNAITLHMTVDGHRKRIQLIRKQWFDSCQEVINKFDFTVCQLVTDGTKLVMATDTAEHIKNKMLVPVNNTIKPDIIKRIIKYTVYGYEPSPEFIQRILDNQEEFNWRYAGTDGDYDGAF